MTETKGEIAWDGSVELFRLIGHPKATQGFAWGWEDHGDFRHVAFLRVPPIDSPHDAVRTAIAGRKHS